MAAINRAQALIEFELDGTVTAANDNFLALMDYTWDAVIGAHHRIFVTSGERESAAYRGFWASLGRGEAQSGVFRRVTLAVG